VGHRLQRRRDGPGALAIALVGVDALRLLEGERDVVEAVSRRCLISGSMSKRNSSMVWAARSIRARPRAAIARHCSRGSSIGSRPFFVQLLRKMSAKRGETIALKP
jgi:hypothetical protein